MASGALGPAAQRSLRFPRSERLRKRFQFRLARDRGRRVHTKSFLLLVAPSLGSRAEPSASTAPPSTRLGITVARQVGNAVRRNRIKRLVRETFRQHRELFPEGMDLVVIAKHTCAVSGLSDVYAELSQSRTALVSSLARPGARFDGRKPGGRR